MLKGYALGWFGLHLLVQNLTLSVCLIWISASIAWSCTGEGFVKYLHYQLSLVLYWSTMVFTINGELGFDSGEAALETATMSKDSSRHENYPLSKRRGSDEK